MSEVKGACGKVGKWKCWGSKQGPDPQRPYFKESWVLGELCKFTKGFWARESYNPISLLERPESQVRNSGLR